MKDKTWDIKKSLMESHNKQFWRAHWIPECITEGEEGNQQHKHQHQPRSQASTSQASSTSINETSPSSPSKNRISDNNPRRPPCCGDVAIPWDSRGWVAGSSRQTNKQFWLSAHISEIESARASYYPLAALFLASSRSSLIFGLFSVVHWHCFLQDSLCSDQTWSVSS